MAATFTIKRYSSPRGLFLCFVLGLFFIQIAFAFTIHGDIGPQATIVPGLDRPVSPVLLGRIDALMSPHGIQKPVRPLPEAAMSPATPYVPQSSAAEVPTGTAVGKRVERLIVAETAPEEKLDGRYRSYTVVKGDTLAEISRKLYGTPNMVGPLVRLNRIQDERRLRLGQILKVPSDAALGINTQAQH